MNKLILIACLVATTALAQAPGPGILPVIPQYSQELAKYLELSNAQVDSIRRLNAELAIFNARKSVRMSQVQNEIQDWTGRDVIDAMQLGLRYAELETIRREMRDEEKATTTKVRAVLNPAQTARLKLLEDAVKLQPLISDAVCENLIEAPQSQIPGTISFAGPMLGQVIRAPFPGCILPAARIAPVITTP